MDVTSGRNPGSSSRGGTPLVVRRSDLTGLVVVVRGAGALMRARGAGTASSPFGEASRCVATGNTGTNESCGSLLGLVGRKSCRRSVATRREAWPWATPEIPTPATRSAPGPAPSQVQGSSSKNRLKCAVLAWVSQQEPIERRSDEATSSHPTNPAGLVVVAGGCFVAQGQASRCPKGNAARSRYQRTGSSQ